MNLPFCVKRDRPLARCTSFRIGGPADFFAEPQTIAELEECLAFSGELKTPPRILGGGTNVLVPDDGIRGLVMRMTSKAFGRVSIYGDRMFAPSGVKLAVLVREAAETGLSGLEPLAGIPGTVGGALRMNAGGQHGCIGDVVDLVLMKRLDGTSEQLDAGRLSFDYRRSSIPNGVITQAVLRLHERSATEVTRRTRSAMDRKSETQPLAARSAGCVFKNPPDHSAGRLIDDAGLKGQRVGGAAVSETHANFVVNTGSATARDVNELIVMIRETVRRCYGVDLELEIDCW